MNAAPDLPAESLPVKPPAVRRRKRRPVAGAPQFAYPYGTNSCDLKFSRKGRKLSDAMNDYASPRLLPKLQARTASSPGSNRYDGLNIVFMDACVYLHAW